MADKRTRVMLTNLVKNGELYAAHQKYRTTAARLLKTPAPSSFGTGKNQASSSTEPPLPYDDAAKSAAELLYEGSRALLEKGELGGGTDLALYLIDTWSRRAVECNDENRTKIQTLIALVGPRGSWRKSIMDHAAAWTSSNPDTPAGDPALHAYIGQVLYKDKDFYGAESHFLAAQTRDTAKQLARLLYDWFKLDTNTTVTASTLGRYAARGVLSYLEGSSILAASIFLETFLSFATADKPDLIVERLPLTTWSEKTASGDEAEHLVTKLASINFLQLAIKTCQIGLAEQQIKRPGNNAGVQTVYPGKQAWVQLVSRYEKEVPWLREPEVKESTTVIAEMYFDIKPSAGGANIFGDILGSLFGGGAPAAGPAGRGRGRGRGAAPRITSAGLD